MSAINTGTINVNYPVPGVNNNSQGFRDNFSGIKNNLDSAAAEITDLQNKAIVKSALSGIPLSNDMDNTLISNALIQGFRNTTYNLGNNLSGTVNIDLTKGDLQYGTITGNTALTFSSWSPDSTVSSVQLMLTVTNPAFTISFPSSVTIGTNTLENYVYTGPSGNVTVMGSLGLDTPSVLHYVFLTKDCGTTIEVSPVNRPRKATQITNDVPTSSIGAQGDRTGAIAFDSTYIYLCVANFDGTTNIWKRVTLTGGAW
jgi:hypothetical protein